MQLNEQQIHIWQLDLDDGHNISALKKTLSEDEVKRAERLVTDELQARFIVARGHLRKLLAGYLGIEPEEVCFIYSEHKKPALDPKHKSNIEFNISHSRNIALYAFCNNSPIGIDIEAMREDYNPDIATRYFSPKEQEQLAELDPNDSMRGFFIIWSKKEAITKATGKGLLTPLASFSVSPSITKENLHLDGADWNLLKLNTPKNYAAAIAYAGDPKELIYY